MQAVAALRRASAMPQAGLAGVGGLVVRESSSIKLDRIWVPPTPGLPCHDARCSHAAIYSMQGATE